MAKVSGGNGLIASRLFGLLGTLNLDENVGGSGQKQESGK
jgi:hypothetical protein